MKFTEFAVNKKLGLQRYFGYSRLILESYDEESLKGKLLDMITSWIAQNENSPVLPFKAFVRGLNDPMIDPNSSEDRQHIANMLSQFSDIVSSVNPENDEIVLTSHKTKYTPSEKKAEHDKEHVKKTAQKALKKRINK